MNDRGYLGNPLLKGAGVELSFTPDQVAEWLKCAEDPIYFIENYVKIVTLDEGLKLMELFEFQKDIVRSLWKNRKTVGVCARQMGKTTCVAAFFAWYVTFHGFKTCAILANKAATAREILSRVQRAYEHLPKWMQHGVVEWNKGSLELENGSRILAASTSSSAIRGQSIDTLFLDEYGFVPNNIADEFFASVYPTITSGKNSKIAIISTPNGLNHFYKIVKEAESGMNGFHPIKAIWSDIPTRDAAWAADTKATLGDIKWAQEMECKFQGGSNTLIAGEKLASLPVERPIALSETLRIYEEPDKTKSYVMTVDTARGLGGDYSAFVIFDVSQLPYRVVAVFRDNKISPLLYPGLILKMATQYNQAAVLVENNDMGESISNSLYYEYEYDMVIKSHDNMISSFGGRTPGFKTTKKSKTMRKNRKNSYLINSFYLIL